MTTHEQYLLGAVMVLITIAHLRSAMRIRELKRAYGELARRMFLLEARREADWIIWKWRRP